MAGWLYGQYVARSPQSTAPPAAQWIFVESGPINKLDDRGLHRLHSADETAVQRQNTHLASRIRQQQQLQLQQRQQWIFVARRHCKLPVAAGNISRGNCGNVPSFDA